MISSTGEACAPPPIRRPQRPRVREEETRVARNCTRELQELPPRQQQMRADGGGEVEPEGQEQPSSGAEKRGLADWSDRASADRRHSARALSWRAGGEQVGNVGSGVSSSSSRLFNRYGLKAKAYLLTVYCL